MVPPLLKCTEKERKADDFNRALRNRKLQGAMGTQWREHARRESEEA
jgi:hypothetical protein